MANFLIHILINFMKIRESFTIREPETFEILYKLIFLYKIKKLFLRPRLIYPS
uniref:Uncharacterized protein n=1 Tax=viral metagenome TaxID=1070528 RepID=A0A6C0AFD1_9ZZZZ